MITAANR